MEEEILLTDDALLISISLMILISSCSSFSLRSNWGGSCCVQLPFKFSASSGPISAKNLFM